MSVRSEIVDGIAEILWGSAWAGHVEEHDCENLSGVQIEEVMPPIPKDAHKYARDWADGVEKANKKKLDSLYDEAMEANEREGQGGGPQSSPTAFGNDLAYMIMGAGVTWFDHNAEFDLEVPSSSGSEEHDLMYLAGSKCKAAWENPPCSECGGFNRPDALECEHCGAGIDEEED